MKHSLLSVKTSDCHWWPCSVLAHVIWFNGSSAVNELCSAFPSQGAALVLQTAVDERVAGECGRMNTNWVSHRAMNCTDSSKHDAISASYCYSLNPNTIRLPNTTIMQGARLTPSSTPSILCYSFSHVFYFVRSALQLNVSFLFLD